MELRNLVEELEKENLVDITHIEKECCGTVYMVDCPGMRFQVKTDVIELIFLDLGKIIVSYAQFYSAERAIEFLNYCKNI